MATERVCSNCVNSALSASGVWCMALDVEIWNEDVAETCDLFEPLEIVTQLFDQDAAES